MAVPDDFGRLRVLLLDRGADGAPDLSWVRLAREVPRARPGSSVPYELWNDAGDGTRGAVHVTVPDRHRAHWGPVAEKLRGQEVRVEATVRPFRIPGDPGSVTAVGVALDLAALGPRPPNPQARNI